MLNRPHLGDIPLPIEITELVLTSAHPRDVAAFAQTCRAARDLVYAPQRRRLWQLLFLSLFDDPRQAVVLDVDAKYGPNAEVDWKAELQRRIASETIVPLSEGTQEACLASVQVYVAVLLSCAPLRQPETGDHGTLVDSKNVRWLAARAAAAPFPPDWHWAGSEDEWGARPQPFAHLHACLGAQVYMSVKHLWPRVSAHVFRLAHRHAAYICGPFLAAWRTRSDGELMGPEVNWNDVEAIVCATRFALAGEAEVVPGGATWIRTRECRPRCTLDDVRAYSAPGTASLRARPGAVPHAAAADWAGVEGHWKRLVPFMDGNELNDFNSSWPPRNRRARRQRLQLHHFFRTHRFSTQYLALVEMHLRIVHGGNDMPPIHRPETLHPAYPPISFVAKARSSYGNEDELRGQVLMYKNGTVRWTMASLMGGELNWMLEGTQVGSVCSRAGVVGFWCSTDLAETAGPFWMWKTDAETERFYLDVAA